MSIKELLKQAEQQTSSAVRIYADISIESNAQLEELANAAKKTKKAVIEWLINNAVEEFKTTKPKKGKGS